MKRSEFLKKLGIGLGVAVVAPQVFAEKVDFTERNDAERVINANDECGKTATFKFNDVFNVWAKNDILIYFNPSHEVYQTLKRSVYNRIVDKKQFRAYLPEHRVLIPVKDEYQMSDFDGLILYLDNTYNDKYLYCENEQGVFLRLIKEKDKHRMHLDLFLAEEKYF